MEGNGFMSLQRGLRRGTVFAWSKSMRDDFLVAAGERPKRLDHYLAGHLRDLSRTQLQRLITSGRVRVRGRMAKPSQRVRGGDRIEFESPPPAPLQPHSCRRLVSLSEDDDLIVVDKPAGVVMHPGSGHWADTIVNAVLHHFVENGAMGVRPRVVHRLDKHTSGVVIIAKTLQAHRGLSRQFAEHGIARRYIALVRGVPTRDRDVIELPIGRDRRDRTHVSADTARPRPAVTHYQVLHRHGHIAARLLLRPRTGRTHQLRAHLHAIGHPIIGDIRYGGPGTGHLGPIPIQRMMLHAEMIGYRHPRTGVYQEHFSPIPQELLTIENLLGFTSNGVWQRQNEVTGTE